MTRNEFINHLYDNDCFPDETFESDEGQMWVNEINREMCVVPYVDVLSISTWCHVIYELRIDPPLKYDADYHVYLGWRNGAYSQFMEHRKRISGGEATNN